jgi:DNA-directed RNA polymerase subunit E'/Rpb7
MYTETVLITTVFITPNQMNKNIMKNILNNLREDVEGKCLRNYGVVTKVHKIERLFGGQIPAEDIRAAACYTVHFSCTLCRPEEGEAISGRVMKIGNRITIMRNGPVNIFVKGVSRAKVGETHRVRILSVTLTSEDIEITAIGKIKTLKEILK